MTAIPFTQYLRPDGRQKEVSIDRSDDIGGKAALLIERGYRFEVEELTTGHASFTVVDTDDSQDIDIEVVPNGPEVPAAVDRLVERVYFTVTGETRLHLPTMPYTPEKKL